MILNQSTCQGGCHVSGERVSSLTCDGVVEGIFGPKAPPAFIQGRADRAIKALTVSGQGPSGMRQNRWFDATNGIKPPALVAKPWIMEKRFSY